MLSKCSHLQVHPGQLHDKIMQRQIIFAKYHTFCKKYL